MEERSYFDFLRKLSFFQELSDSEVEAIAQVVKLKDLQRGRLLFMEGDPGEAVYILCRGLIKLYKVNEEGKEQILHYVHEGGIFAEVVLFDGGPYPATAETVENSLVGVLSNKDMEKLVLSHGQLALKLLRIMSRRLRAAQMAIRDLGLQGAEHRLARLLLRLAERHGEDTAKGIKLSTWITRQEIASIIGTTRETVARILSRFQKEGDLVIDKGEIFLKDGLKRRIDEEE